jgi:hypothetical protein
LARNNCIDRARPKPSEYFQLVEAHSRTIPEYHGRVM